MPIDTQSFHVHDSLPDGFVIANGLQAEQFHDTGSIPGAAKVAQVRGPEGGVLIAVRLRPPSSLEHVASTLGRRSVSSIEEYRSEYEKGWRNARRSDGFPSGSYAHDDGFLDGAAGRPKWHLAHCTNHDECGEG